MLLVKILLRQRYFLSLFTTNLLIALTTQSSLAFSINTNNILPGRGDTQETYTLPNQSTGITRLVPLEPISMSRLERRGFVETLSRAFPEWSFRAASNDLAGRFDIGIYDAEIVGASLALEYRPGAGDPTRENNRLNWIQRVVSNHSHNGDHGSNENIIDDSNNRFNTNPFYYDLPTFLQESIFSKSVFREDTNREHNWLAELYLVEQTGSNEVTVYNGIQWGWENRVEAVPEPLTMFGAVAALGYGALLKRKYSKNTES